MNLETTINKVAYRKSNGEVLGKITEESGEFFLIQDSNGVEVKALKKSVTLDSIEAIKAEKAESQGTPLLTIFLSIAGSLFLLGGILFFFINTETTIKWVGLLTCTFSSLLFFTLSSIITWLVKIEAKL